MKKWQKLRTLENHPYGTYYKVDSDEVITPGGQPGNYFVIRLAPHSVIIPIDSDGNIYMVRQHRYPTNQITLELPMGNTDGQDPLETAKRELEEETGLTAESWEYLGRFQEANGIAEIYGHIYLAHGISKAPNPRQDKLDKNLFELVTFSEQQIRTMILDGTIEDASTICAFAKMMLKKDLQAS